MRDIRTDLKERLIALSGRYADAMVDYEHQREALEKDHRETVEAIRQERDVVEQLLSIENGRAAEPLPVEPRRLVPLMDFLVSKIATHSPIDKDQLRSEAEAAGYFSDGNGRAFHATLMNIVRGGKVTLTTDGNYVIEQLSILPDSEGPALHSGNGH